MFVAVASVERAGAVGKPGAEMFLHSRPAPRDFTQRLGVPQLTQKACTDFDPATETAGMTFRFECWAVPQIQITGEVIN